MRKDAKAKRERLCMEIYRGTQNTRKYDTENVPACGHIFILHEDSLEMSSG